MEASAGGGMVTVKMNGQKQLTEVRIEPEVFQSKDQEMLQELVLAAVNEATRRVDEELSRAGEGYHRRYARNHGYEDPRLVLSPADSPVAEPELRKLSSRLDSLLPSYLQA